MAPGSNKNNTHYTPKVDQGPQRLSGERTSSGPTGERPIERLSAADVAGCLRGGRRRESGAWIACCPAHHDARPSLSIRDENGKVLVHCHAGCDQKDVLNALEAKGIRIASCGSAGIPPFAHMTLGTPTAHWDYFDGEGRHVGRVLRFDSHAGKEIRQASLVGAQWVWKAMREPRPLYRLAEVLERKSATVLVAEGEKACDAAQRLMPDHVAVTWAGGANAVSKTDWSPLAGRDVVLWPDADAPGKEAMAKLEAILAAYGCRVRLVDLQAFEGVTEGWDAADCAAEQIARISVVSRDQLQRAEPKSGMIVSALEAASEATESEWLLRPYLEADVMALMYGDYGTFKSFQAIDWAMRVGLGMPAIGCSYATEPKPVIYISAEGKGVWKRLRAWCIHNRPGEDWRDLLAASKVYIIRRPVNLSTEAAVQDMVAEIRRLGVTPALIIVDTLSRNSDGEPEKSTDAATRYLNLIDRELRVRWQCSVVLVHHVGHGDKGRHRGPIVLAANTDAEIRIVRPDHTTLEAKVEVVRLKDCEVPPPAGIRAVVVEVGGHDRDGVAVTSLALEGMTVAPTAKRAAAPRGRNQKLMHEAIKAGYAELITSEQLHQVGKDLGIKRWDDRNAAIRGLESRQLLLPIAGGFRVGP